MTPKEDPGLMTRTLFDSETRVIPTDLTKFVYTLNGQEFRSPVKAMAGDELEVRIRKAAVSVPPPDEKRDRALYRLLIDLEDVLDASGDEDDEPWFDWARRAAADVRGHLAKKGYVV
jgi:hypothetical protein